jgi:hypothetical protein
LELELNSPVKDRGGDCCYYSTFPTKWLSVCDVMFSLLWGETGIQQKKAHVLSWRCKA